MSDSFSTIEKLRAIYKVANYRPLFTFGLVLVSVAAAFLEGIGLSFILPIVEVSRSTTSEPSGLMRMFIKLYDLINIPFTFENIILGVSAVMIVRYTLSFVVAWLRIILQIDYVRYLRKESFEKSLDASIEFFDQVGSDSILNAIITQTKYSSGVIHRLIEILEIGLVSVVYITIAIYISPLLTIIAFVILILTTFIARHIFESGFSVGDQVAEANEQIQKIVQTGIQGIRTIKLYGVTSDIFSGFEDALNKFVSASINVRKNQAAITKSQRLSTTLAVFGLIYIGLEFASLSIGNLGVFLFAMYRLSPRVSNLNKKYYQVETELPHLIRSQNFIKEIESKSENINGKSAPQNIKSISFENVTFSYDESGSVLKEVSFQVETGESIAFVGPSGAGKSTIISLLASMYQPDSGEVYLNNEPINKINPQSLRDQLAIVRQNPYIFNDTLRYNITMGNNVTEPEIEEAVDISKVSEFYDGLADGYETMLGEDGVRLSGGQKQRIALARALLKDADILLLDEATSDLDRNIEDNILERLQDLDEYIMITVAHRLSAVENADRIYTIIDGRVVEIGTHDELMELDGHYANIYSQ